MRKMVCMAALAAGMVGVASAEVIYIDFYDNGTVNSSPEFYNVLHSSVGNGVGHPLAEGNAGLSMTALVDTDSFATTVDLHLISYNDSGLTAAGGGAIAIGEISGIATNASADAFFCNDKGTAGSDFGFVLTFTNLTGDAYNISLLTATTQGGGTWSVTTGSGDVSVHTYTGTASTSNTLDWTSVVPVDGTIQLTSVNTAGSNWRNVWLAFASLESVTIIGDPPTADNISTNVTEDGSVDITLSGTDPDDDDLTYHVVTLPDNGTLTTNGTTPDVTYTPNPDFVGSDSFTYIVNDGALDSAPATVSITVDPGNNDAPVADDKSAFVGENGSVNITLSGSDPEGSNLTYNVSQPANGTVTTNALPIVTYTPNEDYFGDDEFTYTVNDGTQNSALATVSVTVVELAEGELILNGDFELNDGATGAGSFATFPGWTGTGDAQSPKLRNDIGNDGNVPGGIGNTIIRIINGKTMYQNFNTDWSSNDTFTISLNASEVYWKAAAAGNGLWLSLRNASGSTEYFTHLIDLDGTHSGSGAVYTGWETNQTFSVDVTALSMIDESANGNKGPATAGEELRLNIFSKGDPDSINWLDNVSVSLNGGVVIPPTTVGDISIEVVSGGTEVALTWPTQEGWNYGVKALGNLAFESWDAATMITNGVPGNGGEVTITNPVSPDAEFYRAYLDN